jgi:hypothetical protein
MKRYIVSHGGLHQWVQAGIVGFAPRRIFSVAGAVLLAGVAAVSATGASLGLAENLLLERADGGAFPLVADRRAASVFIDRADHAGVKRAAADLCADVERVSGVGSRLVVGEPPRGDSVVIAGTLGHSPLIDHLVQTGKVAISGIEGKWESFSISTVVDPLPGVARALVIVGSDKRGTIYGLYEISEQIGVSPWYWWADVPTRHRESIFLKAGSFVQGPPAVKYRGIFLNDERPCLTGWAQEKFAGLNSKFYTKIFELLLRLRANYLWPAMWDNAFNEDDPQNPRLADEYGIVMGTSHHEPMMRAHEEWTRRHEQYGNGQWNYATNAEALQRFFREGIARNKNYENIVTIGMRGDGDEAMVSTGSLESDSALLQRIISDQRRILADEMHTDPSRVPQLWALFTEVQKFYEHGLRPPDDVTLLWTDDNTGNLRHLPTAEEQKRSGGAGIYCHFDMHGGPYAYQWINTNPLPKIAEQMNLAYEYGANRIWIVNVGDLKPLELPIEFFLRLAWNPAALTKDKVADYSLRWAERDFGPDHAAEIAELSIRYAKYNGWRKPEIVKPETFSQLNYTEAERVEAAWQEVADRAEKLYAVLLPEQRDAFYQLVLHPAKASALVAEMNIVAGRNLLFAKQGRTSTNALAARVRELFLQDRAMTDYYNHTLAGGKWNHLMDQTHLGQFSWEPPIVNVMPAVSEVLLEDNDHFGVSVEGDVNTWPGHFGDAVLPAFDSFQPRRSYIDVFAMGTQPIDFSITAEQPWIVLTKDPAPRLDARYWVDIDWPNAPAGSQIGAIQIKGDHRTVDVKVPVTKATDEQSQAAKGRYASLTGPIAFAATATSTKTAVGGIRWEEIPDYGRGDAALAIYPVTAASILPPAPAPRLEYPVYLPRSGPYEVTLVLGPVMDFVPDRGMRIAVSFDDDSPQVLDLFANHEAETFLGRNWTNQVTRDNVRYLRSSHQLQNSGPHTLKITMVDPGVVVQKIILNDRKLPESYFGPPECSSVK